MSLVILCLLIASPVWGDSVLPASELPSQLPRIALIIDDLGNWRQAGVRTASLPGLVACAVLPHTPYATRIAERAHAAGKEVMLHLPLQPVERFAATPVGTIRVDTTQSQLARILTIDLASVPYAIGVNNHQGSLLTQHPGHMNWLMAEIRSRGGLFFVDSYTSEASVALRFAREHDIPSIRRDVFLDNAPIRAAIDTQFRRLKKIARARGLAVGIGHPYAVTLDYLEQAIPALRAEGFELIPISQAIQLGAQTDIQTASLEPQVAGH